MTRTEANADFRQFMAGLGYEDPDPKPEAQKRVILRDELPPHLSSLLLSVPPAPQPEALSMPAPGEFFMVAMPDRTIRQALYAEDHEALVETLARDRDEWQRRAEQAEAQLAKTWRARLQRSSLGRFAAGWAALRRALG